MGYRESLYSFHSFDCLIDDIRKAPKNEGSHLTEITHGLHSSLVSLVDRLQTEPKSAP